MTVSEVIKSFNSQISDLEVREIYTVSNNVCLVIAVKKEPKILHLQILMRLLETELLDL